MYFFYCVALDDNTAMLGGCCHGLPTIASWPHISFICVYVCVLCQVRGKDEVGAVMDSMELERQRGITIQVRTRSPI